MGSSNHRPEAPGPSCGVVAELLQKQWRQVSCKNSGFTLHRARGPVDGPLSSHHHTAKEEVVSQAAPSLPHPDLLSLSGSKDFLGFS